MTNTSLNFKHNIVPLRTLNVLYMYMVDTYITYLELGLDLPQLAPGQHLDVRRDLLPRPRLPRPQLDVARYQLVPA